MNRSSTEVEFRTAIATVLKYLGGALFIPSFIALFVGALALRLSPWMPSPERIFLCGGGLGLSSLIGYALLKQSQLLSNAPAPSNTVTDPYSPFPMRQQFALGSNVLVAAACGGWRNESTGVICSGPETAETVQGEDFYYWVKFDVPQFSADNDGPYEKAQILSRCLRIAA